MSPTDGIALLSQRFANNTQRPNLLGVNGVSAGFHSRADLTDRIYDTNLVMNSMLSYDKHYMTTEVMPIMVSEENYFRTVVKELEHMLPTPTPALGTSRTYRSRVHESVSVMKRYGIGAFMEGDFMRTKEGKEAFLVHVAAFHRSDRDNCVLLVYYQLLTNDMRSQFHRAIQETTDFHMYYAILKDERDCFAMPNKFARGCNKLILHNIEEMYRSNSVVPNICIAPAGKMRHLMATGNPEMFRYSNSGPKGPADANAPFGELANLNGVSVREAPTDLARQGYESDFQDIHNREVFLGEFAVCVQHPGADPNSMEYGIYDNVIDDHRYVTFENLFKNNQIMDFIPKGHPLKYVCHGLQTTAPFTGYYVDMDKLHALIVNGPFGGGNQGNQRPHYMYEYGVRETMIDVEEQAERNMYLYAYIRDMMIMTNTKVSHEEVTDAVKKMCGYVFRGKVLEDGHRLTQNTPDALDDIGTEYFAANRLSEEDLKEKKAELRTATKAYLAAMSAASRTGATPAAGPTAVPGAAAPVDPDVAKAHRLVDAITREIKAAVEKMEEDEKKFKANGKYNTNWQYNRAECLYNMRCLVKDVDLYQFCSFMQFLYNIVPAGATGLTDEWLVHADYVCPKHGPGGSDGKGGDGPFKFTARDWHGTGVVGHLAARPMNGYYMTDMILVKGGMELGFLARSLETMHIGDDVGNVSTKLEYRCHAVAHTVNPSRSRVVRNVTYDGIIGGGNALVMTKDQADEVAKNLFRLANICSPSIYSIMIDPRQFDRETEMLHMSGSRPYVENPEPDYLGSYLYQQMYGWDKIGFSNSHGLVDHLYPVATVLFRSSLQIIGVGGQKIYIPGCTHHGQNEGPGHNIVRKTGTSVIPIPMT